MPPVPREIASCWKRGRLLLGKPRFLRRHPSPQLGKLCLSLWDLVYRELAHPHRPRLVVDLDGAKIIPGGRRRSRSRKPCNVPVFDFCSYARLPFCRMRNKLLGLITVVLALVSATGFRRAPEPGLDRTAIEQVFNKYLQSINTADVALASQVWLQSPDVQIVTPSGRFKGWDGVKEIYARMQKEFSNRNVQASNVSIVVAGDAAWLVYDFVFTANLADGKPITSNGWESHGYQRTANGWRIAHLHYSVPPPPS